MQVTFFYDVVCPYAYLGSTQIEAVAERNGAQIVWSPMLLGGVFKAIGAQQRPGDTMPAAKSRHNDLDMQRWAEHFDVPFQRPEDHPRRTVTAMRTLVAVDSKDLPKATHALFAAYWARGEDVSQPETLVRALDNAGLDGKALVEATDTHLIKDRLREATQRAIDACVFGAPTFVVDGELFWGQDRLHFVEKALQGWKPAA